MEIEDNIDNKYIIIKNLGEGTFGKVFLVKTKDTNKEFAVKVLLKFQKRFKNMIQIIQIISSLNNEYITKMIDSGKGLVYRKGEIEGDYQYVVYEYASKGTLIDYFLFPNEISLEEKYAKILFKKILKGVQAMHKIGLCHRDIKLENILLDENFNPKICDFGTVHSANQKLTIPWGTKGYAAPELFKKDGGYDGIKADIFSLGITLLRLVTGKKEDLVEKMKKAIEENKFEDFNKMLNNRIKDTSPEFQSLIVKMIDLDPEKRPIIDDILTNPWFAEVNDNDLNQQSDYIKEFQKREKIKKGKEDKIEIFETDSIECFTSHNFDKDLEDEDYEYFKNEYNIKIINENKKNIKDYIKIIGNIRNPRKFMNSIANKIKKDNKNYKIVASNKKYKFYVNLEYEIDEAQEKFEDKIKDMKDEDEYIDFEYNGLIKEDLKILIELYLTANNNYLIRFYKKSGDLEEYYEKLDRIKSLIKSQ